MNLLQSVLKREIAGAQSFVLPSSWEGGEMAGALETIMDHEANLRTGEPRSLIISWHCQPSPGLPTSDCFYMREWIYFSVFETLAQSLEHDCD